MMETKFWCRSCAAYGYGPCGAIGHISEQMQFASGRWRRHGEPKLYICSPPASGRGAIEWAPCDADGKCAKAEP